MHAPSQQQPDDGALGWYSYPMQPSASPSQYKNGPTYPTFQPQLCGFNQYQNVTHSATSFLPDGGTSSSGLETGVSIWDIIGVGNVDGSEPPLLEGFLCQIYSPFRAWYQSIPHCPKVAHSAQPIQKSCP